MLISVNCSTNNCLFKQIHSPGDRVRSSTRNTVLTYSNSMSTTEIKQKIRSCVAQLPQRENVRKISLFGSHARAAERPDSDIDLLIELVEPVGYFELVRMQDAFSQSLGREVDLVTPKALSKYFRDQVLAEAIQIYEK